MGDFVIENGVLKEYTGSGGDVVIPEGVTIIGRFAFSECEDLTGVALPESLEKIRFGAFSECIMLQEVTIPGKVDTIDESAFSGCSDLKKVTIENGVKEIGREAFSCCTSLAELSIPDSVVKIDDGAFWRCDGLSDAQGLVIVRGVLYSCIEEKTGTVVIPAGVTRISQFAFSGCKVLANVTIPDSVTDIGESAFSGCGSLQSVTIPESVTHIEYCAFVGCKRLENLVIPPSVTRIGDKAFSGCSGLKRIELPDAFTAKISSLFDLEEVVFHWLCGKVSVDAPMETALAAAGKRKGDAVKDMIIEAGDTAAMERFLALWKRVKLNELDGYIEEAGKQGKTEMTAMLLSYKEKAYPPKRQEAIRQAEMDKQMGTKKRSVADWRKIFSFQEQGIRVTITKYKGDAKTVEIPHMIGKKIVVEIRSWGAFKEPNAGGSIIIQNGLRSIGSYAFSGCDGLESIVIPESVQEIGEWAFSYCRNLKSVTIQERVTGISDWAFSGCPNLTIHAPAGSYAEQYAKRASIPFEAI